MFCKCGVFLRGSSLQKTIPDQTISTRPSDASISIKNIPEKHWHNLIEAHKTCSEIIVKSGNKPEPLDTALLVEEYRWFWKPKNVKFVLVAESHVYADKEEISVKIIPRKLRMYAPSYPQDSPMNFAKIVYCPGYGEPEVLDFPDNIENNPGTKQFVDLFRQCLGHAKPKDRSLEWKARILNAVKDKGIWLLDASCHACAKGNKERLPKAVVDRIVPISWKRYVEPIIDDLEVEPSKVWIVGKGVHDLIRGKYATGNNWAYQPNVIFQEPRKLEKYKEKNRRELELQKLVKAALF